MRLGRAAFWRFAIFNIFAASATTALLLQIEPAARAFALPIALMLCLPIGWMGMRRLHDADKSGWHSWVVFVPPAAVAGYPLALTLLQRAIIGHPALFNTALVRFGAAVIIGLWFCGLLAAAGTLRTLFLWLEPGEAGQNRYGAPSQDARAPAKPPRPLLKGRMSRLPFWLLVFANAAAVYGLRHIIAHWPRGDAATNSHALNQISVFLYLPAFIAAVLRLHDRNRSGALALITFVIGAAAPFAEALLDSMQINLMNIAVDVVAFCLLFQCWQPGDLDGNRYGPAPGEGDVPHDDIPADVTPRSATRLTVGTRAARPHSFGRRGA